MNNLLNRFPKLALPFTILTEKNKVRLIAGEDFRYTFTAPNLETWLPQLLNNIDGNTSVKTLLEKLSFNDTQPVLDLINRLYGERILIDGLGQKALVSKPFSLKFFGKGAIFENLKETHQTTTENSDYISILCQEDLNYYELLEFNKQALKGTQPWLWVSYGAISRGFVSPIFLPQSGPCLACLLSQFQRLSPMPEELINYGKENKEFKAASFPEAGLDILKALALWKLSLFSQSTEQIPIYRLHVLETQSLEVSSHRVFTNPECNYCNERY
jgi:bacteriocin biosynthesis cyclodehydratase domain-containing protein